jgi:hypothetical protein
VKPIPVFLCSWILAGLGAVLGSILGNAAGNAGLYAGALLGGMVGVGAAVSLLGKVGMLPSEDRRGAVVGGILGFLIAAPIAATNLQTPIIPVLVCGLVGACLLLGVGVARGWRRGT